MKFPLFMAASLPLVAPLSAADKTGHAKAELLCGVTSYQAGKTVPVAIRLKIEPGWHSYWINPGVGGMPLKAIWTLPAGWKAGDLQQPVPKRFMTGELPGFGYEGEAVFRVDLTPPSGATGEADCKVEVSWLTCNDSACVPGSAELSLKLPAGDGAASEDAALLAAAAKKVPQPLEGLAMKVAEADGKLSLELNAPAGIDLEDAAAFPATPEVVDAAAPITFERKNGIWTAMVPKNEYAEGPAALLDIVLAGGKLERPLIVSWRARE